VIAIPGICDRHPVELVIAIPGIPDRHPVEFVIGMEWNL
jgi:hypothetical protein